MCHFQALPMIASMLLSVGFQPRIVRARAPLATRMGGSPARRSADTVGMACPVTRLAVSTICATENPLPLPRFSVSLRTVPASRTSRARICAAAKSDTWT